MIAVLFAVPHESRDFRRRLRDVRKVDAGGVTLWRGEISGKEVVVGHVGVGLTAAERSARQILQHVRPAWVISAGYGGGLRPDLRVGDAVIDWREVTPNEVVRPGRCFDGIIASSSETLDTPSAKIAFAKASGAHAVDMESAAIAKICAEANLPMIGVRGISDALDDALPLPMEQWFDLRRQRPRLIAMLIFLAAHPGSIARFVRFIRQLPDVRRNLSAAITSLISPSSHREPGAR